MARFLAASRARSDGDGPFRLLGNGSRSSGVPKPLDFLLADRLGFPNEVPTDSEFPSLLSAFPADAEVPARGCLEPYGRIFLFCGA